MNLEKLIVAYNAEYKVEHNWCGINISKPNSKSIKHINKKLNVKLPKSLIEFVSKSKSNEWFASLGEDYDSPFHILKINRVCRSICRRVIKGKGKWEDVFPSHFVAINLGHDDDYDCLDLSKYNPETGEYPIQYWAPPRIFGDKVQPDFCTYMESNLKYWGKL
jgi:hypothetical protein